MNYKANGILLAKEQFIVDLQNDNDYIEFKKRCEYQFNINNYTGSYGVVNASNNKFVIDSIGDTCESLVSNYLNEQNKQ